MIYIPYTTQQLIEKNNDKINSIIVSFRSELGYKSALAFERQLRLFLKKKKSIDPRDNNGIRIRNVADQIRQNQKVCWSITVNCCFCRHWYFNCRNHWDIQYYGFCG